MLSIPNQRWTISDRDVIAMFLNGRVGQTSWRVLTRTLPRKSAWRNPILRYFHYPVQNGGRSSMVEPRIVVPDVAGSNPVGHPSEFLSKRAFPIGKTA